MLKGLFVFLKRNYKLFSIFIFVVVFFTVYNIFLVDRSLVNLQIALNNIAEAKTADDLTKIKHLLKVPILREVSKKKASTQAVLALEAIDNIVSSNDPNQLQDAKFYLGQLIEEKEKGRHGILKLLDQVNARLFASEVPSSKDRLEKQARSLLAKINSTKDEESLQASYYELGNIYVELSDISKAQEAFLKVVQINPKSDIAIKARFNLAWAYKSGGQYDKAIAYFEQIKKEFPSLELAVASDYQIADAFYKKGEYEASRDKYAKLAAENANSSFLYGFSLSEAGNISLFYLNNPEAAMKYFSELGKNLPDSEITKYIRRKSANLMSRNLRMEGFELLGERKYIEAIGKFEKAVEVAPTDGQSFSGLGLGFYWLDQKPKAVERAGKAVEVAAQDEIALINSLFVYINAGKLDEAIKVGEELSKIFIPRTEFYYNLGYAYLLKGMVQEAKDNFERSIRINPDFIFSYNNLGCALWMATAYAQAIQRFQEAIGIDQTFVTAHFNLGVVYFDLKRLEEAYKEFETVLQLNPDYHEAREYLRLITETLHYQP